MKHAYLILAHHEFTLLQTLIDCLDDVRNDIFLRQKLLQMPDLGRFSRAFDAFKRYNFPRHDGKDKNSNFGDKLKKSCFCAAELHCG